MTALQVAVVAWSLAAPADTVLLDFTAEWCGPCRQMQPVVERLQSEGYPVQQVNIDQQQALAAQYQVTGVPCFVMVVEGREVDRVVGATSYERLAGMLQTAAVAAGASSPNAAPSLAGHEQVAPADITAPPGTEFPSVRSVRPLASVVSPAARRGAGDDAANSAPQLGSQEQVASSEHAAATQPGDTRLVASEAAAAAVRPLDGGGSRDISADLVDRLLAATVRIRIQDSGGNSVGTGTIIDARAGEALVLTCGHLFRDSAGKGPIVVDTFGPHATQNVEARLIGYDANYRDVALISFRPTTPIEVAPLARREYSAAQREPVVSLGCDHGADASARHSHITSIDKFLGPPNLQVAGQPVQGRSGGGLFNARGEVIGVCNAADPADDEGLFAALGTIYGQLDELQLTALLASPPAAVVSAPPHLPEQMPTVIERTAPHGVVPTAGTMPASSTTAAQASGNLTAQEQAALEALRGTPADAEVICIVRQRNAPQSASQVIMLDQASPEFFRQLAASRPETAAATATAGRALPTMAR